MKIGLFSDTYHPMVNGITFTLDILYDELTAMGHEVYIFAPAPSMRHKETNSHVIRFPAVKDVLFKDQLTSIFFPPAQVRAIRKLNLDVVHFFTPSQISLFGAFFALKNHIPLVTTYYTDLYEYVKHYPAVLPGILALTLTSPIALKANVEEFRQAFASMRPKRSVAAWNQQIVVNMITVLHNKCNYVIVPSKKIAKQLESWGAVTPITIVPTGVNELEVNLDLVAKYRQQFGLVTTDEVVLYVGRLGSEKNLELSLDAFELLARQRPRAKFMIVGDHDYRQVLEKQAYSLGIQDKIIFTGVWPRDELGNIYALGDVFVFPSMTDTQGLVLHEAATAGLPIVMIDRKVSEVVKDGVNGFYAENNSVDFAQKISIILGDSKLKQQMSLASKQIVSQFGARQQAEKIAQIYQQATRQGQSQGSDI